VQGLFFSLLLCGFYKPSCLLLLLFVLCERKKLIIALPLKNTSNKTLSFPFVFFFFSSRFFFFFKEKEKNTRARARQMMMFWIVVVPVD